MQAFCFNIASGTPGPAIRAGLWTVFSIAVWMSAGGQRADARQVGVDSLWQVEMREVVVTATRGARTIRSVPIPTQVLTARTVVEQGATRLSDLLAEHPGLVVTHDQFGSGIQLQGFDAAYTLILIDGEPVIGREGGVIDLERLPVGDIERVEIVRGPSSSLYGSEALAGVINIITRTPRHGFNAEAGVRYETHGTSDVNASVEARSERVAGRLMVNRYGSDGYDLVPEVPGLTAPSFSDYTVSGHLDVEPADGTTIDLHGRYARMRQISTLGFAEGGQEFTFEEDADRDDWTIGPLWEQRIRPGLKLTTRLYAAGSGNGYTLLNRDLMEESSRTEFRQWYRKAETQLDAVLGTRHVVTTGGGYVGETVRADRVQGGERSNSNGYVFGQHQWYLADGIQVHSSARFDWHTDYASRLSPKLAVMVSPSSAVRFRASVGTGFKAPTFQQLYMDFTNPVAGYSVVGSSDVARALAEFERLGQIDFFLTDPSAIGSIRPENSVAFNLGAEWDVMRTLNLQLNLFRNNVEDLIEHQPVAAKPNGQYVFTYVNLNRIYTQGLELEAAWDPTARWGVAVGYQFLDARDRDVLDRIDDGSVYRRVNGRDERLTRSDYGGLFNRSRHSGSLRLTFRSPGHGLTSTIRAIYRSRYGYGDLNGNLILDDDREYVPGFALVHLTVIKDLTPWITAQAGIKNLLDTTYPTLVPSLPGRLLFAGVNVTIR
jgi:outer membrane receptor for ferrienterochelin and colicins